MFRRSMIIMVALLLLGVGTWVFFAGPPSYNVHIEVTGQGSVSPEPGEHSIRKGTARTLQGEAAEGWAFSHWKGPVNDEQQALTTLLVEEDVHIEAVFVQEQYTLKQRVDGQGDVLVEPWQDTYLYGDTVQLKAQAAPGWEFIGWQGEVTDEDGELVLTMKDSLDLTAMFALKEYSIRTSVAGRGEVEFSPSRTTYQHGDTVIMEAQSQEGWSFDYWTGDIAYPDNPVEFSILDHMRVAAVFSRDEYSLETTSQGRGNIVMNPQQGTYYFGSEIMLWAEAEPGWRFSHWQGDVGHSEEKEIQLTIKEDQQVEAVFAAIPYSLGIEVDGEGRVTVSPEQSTYYYGDTVEIEAIPQRGWEFAGWQGDLEGGSQRKTITVEGDLQLGSLFNPREYQAQVRIEGEGDITMSPQRDSYGYGDTIELTAISSPGWDFIGWEGAGGGREKTLKVTVEDDLELVAVFGQYTVLQEGDNGSRVRDLQEHLYSKGFLALEPDGQFGHQTRLAVVKFQKFFGLTSDGIVGPETWRALDRNLDGSSAVYTVKRGDSLWNLAQQWDTSMQQIREVNNLSNPDVLREGQTLRVPGQVESQQVEILSWSSVSRLYPRRATAMLTDVETGLSFEIYRYGGSNHADIEPLTARDTEVLRQIYGGSFSWERRAVILHIGQRLIAASINGFPHGGQSISGNNFNGHICLHFRNSRLHLDNSVDSAHQAMVEKAGRASWPLGSAW